METKWMIFIILTCVVMSFISSFLDGANGSRNITMMTVIDDMVKISESFEAISWANVANIMYQGGGMIVHLLQAVINMFICNYSFLDGLAVLRMFLIAINLGVFVIFLFELNRALKPFGG